MTIAAANNNNPVLTVPFQGLIYENSPVGTIPRNSNGSNLLKISVTDPDLVCFALRNTNNFCMPILNRVYDN